MEMLKTLFPGSVAVVLAAGIMAATPQTAQSQRYEYGYGYNPEIGVGSGMASGDAGVWEDAYGYSNGIFGDLGFYEDYTNYYNEDFDDDDWLDWW